MGNIDFNIDEAPTASFDPPSPGVHKFVIVSSEAGPNKKGTGKIMKATAEVAEGPESGRKAFLIFNIAHENPKAQTIGRGQLGDLCRACKKSGIVEDSSELHNIPFLARVKHEDQGEPYGVQARLEAYAVVESLGMPASVANDALPF